MTIEICSSHFNEDLEWLKKSQWPVSIVHHEGGAPVEYTYIIPNVGLEASAYLKYIIERYDTLPDHVAFIHGHETAWHQQGGRPMLDMIKTANIEKYDYVPLNNSWRCVNSDKQLTDQLEFMKANNFIVDPHFITCCGGQFIVSKKAILSNTKKQYETWFDSTKEPNDAVCFEMIWHIVFGCGSSIVPYVDHFVPKLDEVLYSTASDVPMSIAKFKPCFLGGFRGDPFITITNKAEYDYYSIRGGTFFVDENSVVDFEFDKNKLNYIGYVNTMRKITSIFNVIASELSYTTKLHV
jgi:hypothetical protein